MSATILNIISILAVVAVGLLAFYQNKKLTKDKQQAQRCELHNIETAKIIRMINEHHTDIELLKQTKAEGKEVIELKTILMNLVDLVNKIYNKLERN